MRLILNGHERELEKLYEAGTVADLVEALSMQADRVALEHNGEIVSREKWNETLLSDGDRVEIVHFVGGGVDMPLYKAKVKTFPLEASGSMLQD